MSIRRRPNVILTLYRRRDNVVCVQRWNVVVLSAILPVTFTIFYWFIFIGIQKVVTN